MAVLAARGFAAMSEVVGTRRPRGAGRRFGSRALKEVNPVHVHKTSSLLADGGR